MSQNVSYVNSFFSTLVILEGYMQVKKALLNWRWVAHVCLNSTITIMGVMLARHAHNP